MDTGGRRCAHDGHTFEGDGCSLPAAGFVFLGRVPYTDESTSGYLAFCSPECRKGFLVGRVLENPCALHLHTARFGRTPGAPDPLTMAAFRFDGTGPTIHQFRGTGDGDPSTHDEIRRRCAHDLHPFDGEPYRLPSSYVHDTEEFRLSAEVFCSRSCRLGYLTHRVATHTAAYELLSRYDTDGARVRAAPPAYTIRSFWHVLPGDMDTVTLDQYRSSVPGGVGPDFSSDGTTDPRPTPE